MSNSSVTFTVRINDNIKQETEIIYGELGLNLTIAINVFHRKSIAVGGFPIHVLLDHPNKETISAIKEADTISIDSSVKSYSDADELLTDLKA